MPDRDQHAFPQDWATGLQTTVDWNDAGSFASLLGHPNLRGYVSDGFEFNVDWNNNLLNISEGKAYLWEPTTETNDHRGSDGPDVKKLIDAMFVAQRGPSGDITLVDNDTNHIYIAIDQTDNDEVTFHSNTTETAPPRPYLKLGIVDTFYEIPYEMYRAPSMTSRRMRVTGPTHGGDTP